MLFSFVADSRLQCACVAGARTRFAAFRPNFMKKKFTHLTTVLTGQCGWGAHACAYLVPFRLDFMKNIFTRDSWLIGLPVQR